MGDYGYNGWTNYATWRINLELSDDRIQFLLEDISNGYLDPFETIIDLADYLENDANEAVTQYGALSDEYLAVQYAQAFVSDANFYEIASTAIADYPQLLKSDDEEDDEQEEADGEDD